MSVIDRLRDRVQFRTSDSNEPAYDSAELWREARRKIFAGTTADEGHDRAAAREHYLEGVFAISVLLVNASEGVEGLTDDHDAMYVSLLSSTVERLVAIVRARSSSESRLVDFAPSEQHDETSEDFVIKRYRQLIAKASSAKERSDLELELARRLAEEERSFGQGQPSHAAPDLLTGDDAPLELRQSATLWAPALADIHVASVEEVASHDAEAPAIGLKSFFSRLSSLSVSVECHEALTMVEPMDLIVYPASRDAAHPVLLEVASVQDYLLRQLRVLGSGSGAEWEAQRCGLMSVAVSVIKRSVANAVSVLSSAYALHERGFSEDLLRMAVMRLLVQPLAGRVQLLYRDKRKEANFRSAVVAYAAAAKNEPQNVEVLRLGQRIDCVSALFASPLDAVKALRDVCQKATQHSNPGADGLLDTLVDAIASCHSSHIVSYLDWIQWFVSIDDGGEDSYVLATMQAAVIHLASFDRRG